MRTLKYAILGLLDQNPMSGYDLSAKFGEALNEFWSAKHSQIYPELKRLTDEGLVEYHIEISGQVLERKVYTITPTGKQDFLKWLESEETIESTPKDVFRLRMFFSSELSVNKRCSLIQHELDQHLRRLQHLEEKLGNYPEVTDNDKNFGDYLVLRGAVSREQAHCEWLKDCLYLCTK